MSTPAKDTPPPRPPIDVEVEKHFQQRRLNIEIGTEVLMQISGVVGRFPSQYVGRDGDRYMIFKVPRAQVSLSSRLVKGAPLVVRYRFQGRIFGFESLVVGSVSDPFGLLFISSPNVIEEHRLRKSQRVDCYFPCSVQLNSGEAAGVIVNLSQQGMRCLFSGMKSTKAMLDTLRDQSVKVTLAIREGEMPLTVPAKIVSAQQFHGAVSAGLRFESLPDTSHGSLMSFLAEWSGD